ncbi:2-keto-4-pentenoate hydratase [Lactiplantibacillus mudanjiangensis]|uniref:2-keto-4-pentenoate hydratase [Lactobacillus pentosus] n=1 Tax=Lactiplantibacillus mudanjiangensis TaxID=1296538 RepID=A0A660DTR7_9LACO|nr:2-keto-4-pentenoate hydratase [Lactiplantibacillus mudanjiangensis]VDG20889.1 2-keto-4-pentenoate hydratase [Lactobacillus pentosus] [Lactiplantibacillus mudanjiangensis]VDG22620.1 2-keto-4-pentenoate hydratase [Lactobacillus pentosus] [Lactiplantibacillus mudanjiangensis]VDG26839.1 2-keto-4-pentenoate hydratase [Lactobacillus pentosus] [Lactiplantibacillus mudanjiangensis]VDG31982.1 2-keto-4-pentenoate hydratase [Lactobacillus pentosus] [Lactiplantibacillus mudanjiangensis]
MTNTTTTTPTETETKFATQLFDALRTQHPLNAADFADVVADEDAAYRVQDHLTTLKNQPVGGYKVSLTSEETQKMFDAHNPLYGAQVQDHFLAAPAKVRLGQLMDPLVEVELVFKAKETLSPEDSLTDLWHKTTVAPGLELPDSRFADWFPSLAKNLVVADAAVGGLVVYGEERDTDQQFDSVDAVATVKCELTHDGETLKSGVASEVLGNPLNSLHWLVGKLAEQGRVLTKGQRVSSGTFVLPPHLTAGHWQATFDQQLGQVDLDVTND